MLINEDQVVTNEGGYIPEQTYRVRIINTKFDMRSSQKKAPMTTLQFEVIEPESGIVNGKEVTFAGRKGNIFLIHDVNKGGWASQEQVQEFCEKLGIDLTGDNGKKSYDTDKHAEYFKGKEFDIPLSCREQKKVYSQDNPQTGKKKGEPILDAEGGEISLGYQIQANPSDVPENPRVSTNEVIASQPY
jgi:hypothetical protein